MKKFLSALGVAALAASFAQQADATTFNFDYTFDGTTISQDAGSDTADGTSLAVGDGFVLTVSADGSGFWTVDALFNDFVPLSYRINDSTDRTATISTTWLLDGVVQTSLSETVTQSSIHVGAESWSLNAGLMFDEVIIDWTFDAISDPVNTIINASGVDFFNGFGGDTFFRNSEISYTVAAVPAAVPLPAGALLLLGGLGALGLARRRRKAA